MKNTVNEERLKKQLTQVHLSELVGVSRQTIFSIEIHKYVPSVVLSLKLAKALEKKVEDIFKLEQSDWNFCIPVISFEGRRLNLPVKRELVYIDKKEFPLSDYSKGNITRLLNLPET